MVRGTADPLQKHSPNQRVRLDQPTGAGKRVIDGTLATITLLHWEIFSYIALTLFPSQHTVVLETVRMAKLVNEPLRSLSLFHDSFFVVLTNGTAEFVIIHSRPILSFAP